MESGLLASLGDDGAGGIFFGTGLGGDGTGGTSFFGTCFGRDGIGVLFFGLVGGDEGTDLNAAGVEVGFGVSFLLAVAGTTAGGEVDVASGSSNLATGLPFTGDSWSELTSFCFGLAAELTLGELTAEPLREELGEE